MTDRPPPPRTGLRASAADRLLAQANALAAEGRAAEAEAVYRRILEKAPDHAEAVNNLGNVLDALGRHDEAVAAYRRLLGLGYLHPVVCYNIGSTLRRAGRPDEAGRALRCALILAPDYAEAHNNLGNLLRDSGRAEGAVVAYRRALAAAPGFETAHENLAAALYLLVEAGARAAAARHAEAWLRDHPDHPMAHHVGTAIAGRDGDERASDDYVRRTFDRFAGEFERTLTGLGYRAPDLLAAAVETAGPGNREGQGAVLDVLDAGCGTGLCAPLLRPLARHLAGVDLSGGMLEHARARNLYDSLEEAELGAFLDAHPLSYDLIVAADVLCYFGALDGVLAAAAGALRPGGLLAFTVERLDGEGDHRVNPHGRYAHAEAYVRRTLAGAGFTVADVVPETLRHESGRPVEGFVVTARRV